MVGDGAPLNRAARGLGPILAILPALYLGLFFVYPLARVLALGLFPGGQWDPSGFLRIAASPFYRQVVAFTIYQALASTLLTLALGLPAAYAFARLRFPGQALLHALASVPFVLPTVVVAAAFSALLGPQGWLNTALRRLFDLDRAPLDLQHGLGIILLAHVFYNYAVVLRIVGGFWRQLDPGLAEAARVLGAGPWAAFRHLTLPLLAPAIAAAAALVFLFNFTSFGVILILGGPRFNTLETAIYRSTQLRLDLPLATALALVQLAITLALSLVYGRLQERIARPLDLRHPDRAHRRPPRTRGERLLVAGVLASVLLLLLPPLALVLRSLSGPEGPTLDYYRQLFTNTSGPFGELRPWTALGHSLRLAAVTLGIALPLGLLAAQASTPRAGRDRAPQGSAWARRLYGALLMLPLGSSAVTLGFGLLIGFPALRNRWLILPLAHGLVALPFVVRSLAPVLASLQPRLREAAAVLGAGPFRAWREAELPVLGRALAIGAVFAFGVSMGEFGATAMLAQPDAPTLPYAIYRYLSLPGALNYGQAMAMASLLMLVVAGGVLAIEAIRPAGPAEL